MTNLAKLALLSVFLALPVGCCHDLQEPFVRSMETTMIAIEYDVEAGIYKPDAMALRTLHKAKTAISDARAVVDAEKEK